MICIIIVKLRLDVVILSLRSSYNCVDNCPLLVRSVSLSYRIETYKYYVGVQDTLHSSMTEEEFFALLKKEGLPDRDCRILRGKIANSSLVH